MGQKVTNTGRIALGAFLLAGCGGRTVGAPFNQNNTSGPDSAVVYPDGGIRPDGSVRTDGSASCEEGESWELQMTPLEGITVLNPQLGGDYIPHGVTVRIEVLVGYTGCDEFAGVQVAVHPESLTLLLYGYVWSYTGLRDCPHESRQGVENLALRNLRVGEWHAADYLVNQPGVPFYIRDCMVGEDCQCVNWQGIPGDWGALCQYDCMCEESLGCVYDGSSDGMPYCFQTCSVTEDCPIPLFCNYFMPQTAEGVCMSTGLLDSCQTDEDCAPGHQCLPVEGENFNWCQPVMGTNAVGRPCDDDCGCPGGFRCVVMNGDENSTCQIWCRGNQQCPMGMYCDPQQDPAGPLANSLVCLYLVD